ncbi:ADP-dependent NAD(P)H-hydrate dehydratase [Nocardioides deserti]|uniref:ADP-dependent (S)-NAD(P)H-hydrate dehydratase n=1 Tax=Nocardioides deserti TaxID=1588644 RepID=A0ABR6U7L1_9ACTN|nr:NAD(P)H-hydrate dehydratase [Nocardioides deserti]MBC2960402.1 NAD(P)H-hydrate dehydratase [Nocardioides deserti]GGO71499.1 ADP-dependent (S)-NAD(P)H-hydrate dehydratase [Nocardioides deserti]
MPPEPSPVPRIVTPGLLRGWPLPDPGEDKNARGRVVLLAGSRRSPGAVLLAAEAALRAGSGKVTAATIDEVVPALAVAAPEVGVVPLDANAAGRIDPGAADTVVGDCGSADVLLAGPGFVDPDDAVALLEGVLPRLDLALVLDALGSAYLTAHPDGLHHLEGCAVLTVNPSELAQTAGVEDDDVAADPVAVAGEVAARSRVVVVCGGTEKHVVTPSGDAWTVEGGGPGLGASGSGDVQAGIVAGLLARGAEPAQAAAWGGYVHARCGERLAAAVGPLGYLARELPSQVPAIMTELS